jgi:hypothetical protein
MVLGGFSGPNKFDKIIKDINTLDEVFRNNFYQKKKIKIAGLRRANGHLPKIKIFNDQAASLLNDYNRQRL